MAPVSTEVHGGTPWVVWGTAPARERDGLAQLESPFPHAGGIHAQHTRSTYLQVSN